MTDYWADRISTPAKVPVEDSDTVRFPSGTSTHPDAAITHPEGGEEPIGISGELKTSGFESRPYNGGCDPQWSSKNTADGYPSAYRETDDDPGYNEE